MKKSITAPITREINVRLRARDADAPRGSFGFVGSFIAVRFEDPEGKITVKWMHNARRVIESAMADRGVALGEFVSAGWNMDGVVFNWERR